jgi:hypothetical protein
LSGVSRKSKASTFQYHPDIFLPATLTVGWLLSFKDYCKYYQEGSMTYLEKLNPWCIVKLLPNMQHQIVTRFRRRSDAEAHIQVLRRLIPSVTFTIIFNPALEQEEHIISQ